jgi:Cu(I)/Ag(I) efflux system membrane fusion protein/cobalt-zinc-cadmium efflux system membrane fusion protein
MDWNVISDEPGRCPLCEMKLSEVTLDEAKNNLKENGFEYK